MKYYLFLQPEFYLVFQVIRWFWDQVLLRRLQSFYSAS